jgi:hypothetical protein
MPRKNLGLGMTPSYVDMMLQGAKKRALGRALNSIHLLKNQVESINEKRKQRNKDDQRRIDNYSKKLKGAEKQVKKEVKKKKTGMKEPYQDPTNPLVTWQVHQAEQGAYTHRRDKKH